MTAPSLRKRLRPLAVIAVVLGLAVSWFVSSGGEPMAVPVAGKDLPACPNSPNCVSSQATDPGQRVEPFPLRGTANQAILRLAAVIENTPGGRVVERTDTGLSAEFRTRWLRFVDDLIAVADEEQGVLHVRSASRLGYSDFGVNRRRVESLRDRYLKATDAK